MASSAEELTECVICTEIFTDPQVLPCDHTFCKVCVNRLTQGGAVKCPNCNKVCLRDDVKPDFRLATFLDALAKQAEDLTGSRTANVTGADHTSLDIVKCEACDEKVIDSFCHQCELDIVKCEACDEKVIDSFCHQCEQWFCKGCTKTHGKMKLGKGHTYTSLAEETTKVKSRIQQRIEDIEAKINDMKSAAAQNAKTMTEIEAAQTQAKQTSQQLRADLHEDVDKYFDVIDERIDSFCKEMLDSVKKQGSNKYKPLCNVKADMDKLLKKHDSNILVESQELISNAQKLIKSLNDVTEVAVDIPRVSLERNATWSLDEAVNLQLEQVTRKLKIQHKASHSLLAAAQKQWVKKTEVKLPHLACAVRVINQQLWCCCWDAGIVVLDHSDLKHLRTIPAGDMGRVRDVAEMRDGDIVIAADKGLFHSQNNGYVQSRITTGDFTSVAVHRDQVFAAGYTKPKMVHFYKRSGSSWVKVHSVSVDLIGWITLSVNNNHIKCCLDQDHKIAVYSLSGELLQTYGTPGRVGGAGQLYRPYICTDDDDGRVLIADRYNDRLQVMSEQGEFSVLQLQPPVSEPRSAVLFNNQLYVATPYGSLYKYL